MEVYDEDLTENKFFAAFQHKSPSLFKTATECRWMLCVPRSGSLNNFSPKPADFENHVLLPDEEDPGKFSTHSEKAVTIQSNLITTGFGFSEKRAVPILFEETFFNESDESYRVLCINQPLEGGHASPEESSPGISIQSLEDCADLLWGRTNNQKTQKQLDDQLEACQKSLQKLEGQPLVTQIDAANSLFTKAMQIVLKDNVLKRAAKHNQVFMEGLKLAVETYISHGIYRSLFRNICTCLESKDSELNKVTRNLANLQLRDLGVRLEFGQNVPRARKELSNLGQHSTPLGKLNCLKRVVKALTHPAFTSNKELAFTTDDLLPILVFLVVKAEMPNWYGNFTFMTSFRFSRSNNGDEYGFYLASLEAALEHVSSGQLKGVLSGDTSFKAIQLASSPGSTTLWQRQDSEISAIEKLFQHIKDNNLVGVENLLNKTPTPVNKDRIQKELCHPLCTCEKCGRVWAANWEAEENAQVTVYSRDDRGYTVLHVAAMYGTVEIADQLLRRGAVVNATDYHGASPLHIACQKGHQSLLFLLLHFKANVNLQENDGNTALHLATANGHEDCVKAMVYHDLRKHSLNKNAVTDFGDTPLHIAAKWGYYAIVELLLQNGARSDIRNRKNLMPVNLAHNVKVAKLLQESAKLPAKAPALKQPMERRHSTPVGIQTKQSTPAPVTIKPPPKKQLKQPKRVRVVTPKIIQDPGSKKLTQPQERRVEKLLKVVADGDEQMVRFHLGWSEDSDEEVPEVDVNQQQLCHPLCQCAKCQPLQKLLSVPEDGLHISCHNSEGFQPLHVATIHAHLGLVQLFLKRGADVDAANFTQDATPLHLACKNNRSKVVNVLVQHGASVNRRDSTGNTPLLLSCMSGNDSVASLLLENGANVNLSNSRGNTPLHEASRWNFLAVVKVLLGYGADVNILNRQNLTPVQVTQNSRISDILEEHIRVKTKEEFEAHAAPSKHANDILRDVFTSLEESDIHQRQTLCSSIHQFDIKHGLRHTVSHDRSLPFFDDHLIHQLSIRKFNSQRLRRTRTVESMDPVVIFTEEPECEDSLQTSLARERRASEDGADSGSCGNETEDGQVPSPLSSSPIPLSDYGVSSDTADAQQEREQQHQGAVIEESLLLQTPDTTSQSIDALDSNIPLAQPETTENITQDEATVLPQKVDEAHDDATRSSPPDGLAEAEESVPHETVSDTVIGEESLSMKEPSVDNEADKISADSDLASEDSKTESEKDWSGTQ